MRCCYSEGKLDPPRVVIEDQIVVIKFRSTDTAHCIRKLLFEHAHLLHFIRTCNKLAKELKVYSERSNYGEAEKMVVSRLNLKPCFKAKDKDKAKAKAKAKDENAWLNDLADFVRLA